MLVNELFGTSRAQKRVTIVIIINLRGEENVIMMENARSFLIDEYFVCLTNVKAHIQREKNVSKICIKHKGRFAPNEHVNGSECKELPFRNKQLTPL